MAAILIGGLMDSVRRPVEVVCKQKLDLAPIPRHKMVGEIVAVLDLPLLLENATGIHVRVSPIFFYKTSIYQVRWNQNRINALQSTPAYNKDLLAEICHFKTSWAPSLNIIIIIIIIIIITIILIIAPFALILNHFFMLSLVVNSTLIALPGDTTPSLHCQVPSTRN